MVCLYVTNLLIWFNSVVQQVAIKYYKMQVACHENYCWALLHVGEVMGFLNQLLCLPHFEIIVQVPIVSLKIQIGPHSVMWNVIPGLRVTWIVTLYPIRPHESFKSGPYASLEGYIFGTFCGIKSLSNYSLDIQELKWFLKKEVINPSIFSSKV